MCLPSVSNAVAKTTGRGGREAEEEEEEDDVRLRPRELGVVTTREPTVQNSRDVGSLMPPLHFKNAAVFETRSRRILERRMALE